MGQVVAGLVAIGTLVVVAGIVYQVVKPNSQGPAVVKTVVGGVNTGLGTIFKG